MSILRLWDILHVAPVLTWSCVASLYSGYKCTGDQRSFSSLMVVDKEWAFIAHTVTALQDTWLHLFVASHSKCFLRGYFLPVSVVCLPCFPGGTFFLLLLCLLCFPGGIFLPVSAVSSCFPGVYFLSLPSCFCCIFSVFLGDAFFLLLLCFSSYSVVSSVFSWESLPSCFCCVFLVFFPLTHPFDISFVVSDYILLASVPLHVCFLLSASSIFSRCPSRNSDFPLYPGFSPIAKAPSSLFYLDFVTTSVTGSWRTSFLSVLMLVSSLVLSYIFSL